jgi:protein Tex
VHQDGLVHISELSNRYIRDPAEAVKVGQIVKVQVLNADAKNKRIALSIKALLPLAQKSAPRLPEAPAQKAPVRLDDKISVLADKWKRR